MKQSFIGVFSLVFLCTYSQTSNSYYQSIEGKKAAEIKTELHKIIAADTINNLSYGSGSSRKTWFGFYNADRIEETNQVIDMYSSILRYFASDYVQRNYPGFGQELHIEHSFPKSWWGGHEWAAYKDLYHLYPADGPTNSSKNNYPLGVVVGNPVRDNGVSKLGKSNIEGYSDNVFEPADEYKGDFARSYFYVVTAYENYYRYWNSPMTNNNTYPVWKEWAVNLLLTWHRNDPVSEKELKRIEKVQSIQGNRNPFIDYPELAEYIWGNKMDLFWTFATTADKQTEYSFAVYPNPAKNYINISNCPQNTTYEIYNISGSLTTSGVTNSQINVSELNSGYYILVLKDKDKQFRLPIIIE